MEFICNFCNKQYNSLSSLNHHQKSAKFCLELQKKIDNVETNIKPSVYNCEYCEKSFTTKFALNKHTNTCNTKIYQDKVNNQIKEIKLKEEQYLKEKSEFEKQILNFQYELKEKENQIKELKVKNETTLKEKSEFEKQILNFQYELKEKENQRLDFLERISKLENTIKEKDTIIKEKDTIIAKNLDKLADSVNRPNIVNNNNNTYTMEFNKLKNEILPFTDENVRNCIKTINSDTLIYFNDFDVNANFIGKFINCIKTLTFCTDAARGCLVIKDENGKSSKIIATAFIVDCFKKGQKECIHVIDKAVKFLEKENNNQNIDDVEYSKCLNMLTYIKGHIVQGTINDFIKEISSNLTKNVPQITKNRHTNLLIEG